MNGSVEAINIVFDGPPHMTVGGFVEVETDDGMQHEDRPMVGAPTASGRSGSRMCRFPVLMSSTGQTRQRAMTPNREASQPADSRPILTPELTGPVELELAEAVEKLPGRKGLPGGSRYELKYDGYLH